MIRPLIERYNRFDQDSGVQYVRRRKKEKEISGPTGSVTHLPAPSGPRGVVGHPLEPPDTGECKREIVPTL